MAPSCQLAAFLKLATIDDRHCPFIRCMDTDTNIAQPLRALHFIKRKYPRKTFETSLHYLFHCFWTPPNTNLCLPENLATALSEVPADFGSIPAGASSTAPLFSTDEVQAIMAATSSQEVKEQLKAATKEALDRGAFGNPWLWVTNNRTGKAEPFFGSDRYVPRHVVPL